MIVFSTFIVSDFKNDRIKAPVSQANGAILLWPIRALVEVVGMTKYFLRFFKANPALRITSESEALLSVKLEAHKWLYSTVCQTSQFS